MSVAKTKSEEVLFPPNTKGGRYFLTDLRKEYPELNRIDEFRELRVAELYFVWLYACPTSPLAGLDIRAVRTNAVKMAFLDNDGKIRTGFDEEYIDNCMAGVYPEEVNAAIKRMQSFNPNIRYRAKQLAEQALANFQEFVNKDINEMIDTDERKKYVDMVDKILDALPGLIEKVESGYGIKTVVQKTDVEGIKGKTLMDLAHEEEVKRNG